MPSHDTGEAQSTKFEITDTSGSKREYYSHSFSIIISEGNYESGSSWDNVAKPAFEKQDLLTKAFETRGFRVITWKDVKASEFRTIIDDIRSNLGMFSDARLFFYYYGHGYIIDKGSSGKPKLVLVPIDAPNPLTNEDDFFKKSIPISKITSLSDDLTEKHAFFAFEACKAGSIFASLDGPPPPNPLGYILSKDILNYTRQYLTAGRAGKSIPAEGVFTQLIINGLSEAPNNDGYVTGSELMTYVMTRLPQLSAENQSPEHASLPLNEHGDFIFGAANPAKAPPRVASGSATLIRPELAKRAQILIHVNGQPTLGDAKRAKEQLSQNGLLTVGIVEDRNPATYRTRQVRYYNDGDAPLAEAVRTILGTVSVDEVTKAEGLRAVQGLIDVWL